MQIIVTIVIYYIV